MNGHGVGSFRGDALSDVELHALISYALERSIDGAIYMMVDLLFWPRGSHCS